jgi:hypothetical protein
MFVPRLASFCSVLLWCATAPSLAAQSGSGFVLQKRAGVVFVKPQPWSRDSEATVFEFQGFINRTADGGFGAGYYEFQTKNADRRQIPTARIVKLVIYPDVQEFGDVVGQQDRWVLVSAIEELERVAAKYPSSRSYLEPSIGKLNEELAQFDSGNVKSEGVWISRQTYIKRMATKLASQLKAEIARAQPPSSMNLEDDPRFISLKELAGTDVEAKRLATEVSTHLEALVREEKRRDLLAKLARPTTTLAEAKAMVEQLRALRPNEDPKAAAFVKTWNSGLVTAEAASAEAEEICASLERELADFNSPEGLPPISAELDKQIFALKGRITRFMATHPPNQLVGMTQRAAAICDTEADFTKLKAILVGKQYLDAKDVLDALAGRASLVGPQTVRVVATLQRSTVEKIEEFTRLRAEGKLLAESGKKLEALEKFDAAFAVVPDAEVGQQISQLKEEVSAVSSEVR